MSQASTKYYPDLAGPAPAKSIFPGSKSLLGIILSLSRDMLEPSDSKSEQT